MGYIFAVTLIGFGIGLASNWSVNFLQWVALEHGMSFLTWLWEAVVKAISGVLVVCFTVYIIIFCYCYCTIFTLTYIYFYSPGVLFLGVLFPGGL